LKQLFRGGKAGGRPQSVERANWGDWPKWKRRTMRVLSIAAGAALLGVFFLRRRLWPVRLAGGRFVELAAPVVVPVLLRRIAGRESAN